jgi:P2-related tail formation protein
LARQLQQLTLDLIKKEQIILTTTVVHLLQVVEVLRTVEDHQTVAARMVEAHQTAAVRMVVARQGEETQVAGLKKKHV